MDAGSEGWGMGGWGRAGVFQGDGSASDERIIQGDCMLASPAGGT